MNIVISLMMILFVPSLVYLIGVLYDTFNGTGLMALTDFGDFWVKLFPFFILGAIIFGIMKAVKNRVDRGN